MQKKAEGANMAQRKRWNKMGRLAELHRRLCRGQIDNDQETNSPACKLYGASAWNLDPSQVEFDKKQIEKHNSHCQQTAKSSAINEWKQRMRKDITSRSGWLNKKGSSKPVAVNGPVHTTTTKKEALDELRNYWGHILHGNGFTTAERNQRASELINSLFDQDIKNNVIEGRPDLEHFRKCLRSVKGCAGADGWCKEELRIIAENETKEFVRILYSPETVLRRTGPFLWIVHLAMNFGKNGFRIKVLRVLEN